MKIDFVSDVSCPWCAIGLNALEEALARVAERRHALLENFRRVEQATAAPGEKRNR